MTELRRSPCTSVETTSRQTDGSDDGLNGSRKKQRRNKPTLSCEQCSVKKTKCDRGRPKCLACVKRGTECQYTNLADMLDETNSSQEATSARRIIRPVKTQTRSKERVISPGQDGLEQSNSLQLLSNVAFTRITPSNIFGIGSEHPFSNYWTCNGGLPEVVSVLPSRQQADILIEKYFDAVDPVYPMLHRPSFYEIYEHFWSLPSPERDCVDGGLVGLIFVMLAMGTQFVPFPSREEKAQTAEFYVSASSQALRESAYLSRPSTRTIQAMVLITYFLMNDNHASDGWAYAGIIIRQAYALGLNRDPSIIIPNACFSEKQQRRKLWQAVLLQDTFLTVILRLPPTATHADVRVEDLEVDDSSIGTANGIDTAYVRAMWSLANLVQEKICSPRSLDLPIASTTRDKSAVISKFKELYRSIPAMFRTWDNDSICSLVGTNERLLRQILFLTSNYFHCVMLVQADETDKVPINIAGTLDAAHEAITSFFLLHRLLHSEARVWYHFQHRAFSEALLVAELLQKHAVRSMKDPIYVRAEEDVRKMVEILRSASEYDDVARSRVAVLNEFS